MIIYIVHQWHFSSNVQIAVANDPGSPDSKYVVWHIFETQTEADFVYPATTGVGAYYFHDNVKLVMGPFSAELGSTWEIDQENKHSPKLKKGTSSFGFKISCTSNFCTIQIFCHK